MADSRRDFPGSNPEATGTGIMPHQVQADADDCYDPYDPYNDLGRQTSASPLFR
jgi:hypothetical protein